MILPVIATEACLRGLGLMSGDDEKMPVICPTCQLVFSGNIRAGRRLTALHGVVFDIFSASYPADARGRP
jgi:hypothetical protein